MRPLVRLAVASALAWGLAPSLAAADLRAWVVARTASGELVDAPVQARVGDEVTLTVALEDEQGLWADAPVRSGRHRRRPAGPLPAGLRIAWHRVVPALVHTRTASPNPGIASFSNAVLTGPRHGEWLGYDTLEYDAQPIAASEGTPSAALLTLHADRAHGGAGSRWLAAEITLADGRRVRTPDETSVDRLGLTREVMRVSFRTGDDYLGWLSTYFDVPNLFGSSGGRDHQTDRYVGADCADVLVGGWRAMGHRVAYASVSGVATFATPRTEAFAQTEQGAIVDGEGRALALRWGREIAPGDLVTIDYASPGDDALLPRAWDHIGALVSDADGDGVLSTGDVVRHMSTMGLADEPLAHHGSVRLRVYRWRESGSHRRERRGR